MPVNSAALPAAPAFLMKSRRGGFEGAVRLLRHAELLVAKEEEKERRKHAEKQKRRPPFTLR
jgi:hypothetical protein